MFIMKQRTGITDGKRQNQWIREFKGLPFRVEYDMQLFELSRSIGEKEVMVSMIVRPNRKASKNIIEE